MKYAIAIALAALAFPLFAVLNSGAQAQMVIVETNNIKAVEKQQVRKRWTATTTATPRGASTVTPGPKVSPTATPTASPGKR